MTVRRTTLEIGTSWSIGCWVADIVYDLILGLDVVEKFGFVMDIKNRVVKVGNEELILCSSVEEPNNTKLLLTKTV